MVNNAFMLQILAKLKAYNSFQCHTMYNLFAVFQLYLQLDLAYDSATIENILFIEMPKYII